MKKLFLLGMLVLAMGILACAPTASKEEAQQSLQELSDEDLAEVAGDVNDNEALAGQAILTQASPQVRIAREQLSRLSSVVRRELVVDMTAKSLAQCANERNELADKFVEYCDGGLPGDNIFDCCQIVYKHSSIAWRSLFEDGTCPSGSDSAPPGPIVGPGE